MEVNHKKLKVLVLEATDTVGGKNKYNTVATEESLNPSLRSCRSYSVYRDENGERACELRRHMVHV